MKTEKHIYRAFAKFYINDYGRLDSGNAFTVKGITIVVLEKITATTFSVTVNGDHKTMLILHGNKTVSFV